MEAIVLVVILCVLFIVLLPIIIMLTFKRGINEKIDRLSRLVEDLGRELRVERMERRNNVPGEKEEEIQEEPVITPPEPERGHWAPPAQKSHDEPLIETPEVPEEIVPEIEEHIAILRDRDGEITLASDPPEITVKNEADWKAPDLVNKEHSPAVKQDWEKFIGENLINKIGIGVLVLGIGFFVKYAIDKDWIGETFRVFIGIICGGILIGIAHRMRKTYKAFSSVLVGGGIAVLYFTIAIAFHEYQLLTQTGAFIVMVLITSFAVILSIAYDRIELAILAILGGFATPFMVSTGEGNYIVLFTYIAILNTGMLVLSYYKKWHPLNVISFIFTILLYGSWLIAKFPEMEPRPLLGAFIFASLFYFIFFLMTVIYNIKANRKFDFQEISILVSNTFLYYSAGMFILDQVDGGKYKGLFTALVAVYNFLFAFVLYRNNKVDRNLVYLLIGLVLTFLSLTAPIQLEGNYITLFWAAEAVLLLWLSQRSGIRLVRIASVVVMVLMCISLTMDWFQLYGRFSEPMRIVFNKAFLTGVAAIVSISLTLALLRRDNAEYMFRDITLKEYGYFMQMLLIICGYIFILLELNFQLITHGFPMPQRAVIIGAYTYMYLSMLMILQRNKRKEIRDVHIILTVVASLFYLLVYNQQVIEIRQEHLDVPTLIPFLFHYITLFFLLLMLWMSLRKVRMAYKSGSDKETIYLWLFCFMLVYLSCAEADHLMVLYFVREDVVTSNILQHSRTTVYPIIWGLFSFLFMFLGMRSGMKNLRIISLSLFFLTLVKLFTFDIRQVSEGGKIAAFIFLGVLLLIVSFMYQRLKKLIFEDKKNEEEKP